MAKFRKKPVVIEAVQFLGTPESEKDVLDFVRCIETLDNQIVIRTLEGNMTASAGDWIIKGVSGEFYPCKPDIFEKTYEKVKESETIPEPKIKPLEWIEEDTFVAFGSFGTFEVYETGGEEGLKPWMGSLNDSNYYDGFGSMDFDTVEEAKAYCNSLHEKQIRGALKFVEAPNGK
jgi:hypothetical protein